MRRAPRLLLLALLLVLAVPAAAQAASVAVTPSADPLEDRPVTFTASAQTDGQELRVWAYQRPDDANPCAAKASDETGRSILSSATSGATGSVTYDEPGRYKVCAYLSRFSNDPPAATATLPFDVRANRAGVAVTAPPTAFAEADVPVSFSGSTEVGRQLFARVKPVGAGPCGPSWTTDQGSTSILFGTGVTGAFAGVPDTTGTLRDTGQYLVCAYLQEGASDPVAEAVGSAVIAVVPPVPVLGELDLGSRRFSAARSGAALRESPASDGSGTGISFAIPNTAASVRFTVYKRVVRRGRTRYVRVRGAFTVTAKRYTTYLRFSGRIGGRQLPRGRYRLQAVARTASGTSQVRRASFTVVGRR